MRHQRQGPRWWQAWVPLLLLGGLLVLEPLAPLSPWGHQMAQLAITLLMFGVVVTWLRRHRGALVNREYEREQARLRARTGRQPRPELSLSHGEPWEDAELPWQDNAHGTDIRRKP